MRTIAILIILVIGYLSLAAGIYLDNYVSVVDRVMSSVVLIESSAGWSGSGSYVEDSLILTAGHVVSGEGYGAMEFTITFENGVVFKSDKSYLEPTADVGFIVIDNCDSPILPFDNDGYSRGDTVFVYGNPYGRSYCFSVTKGIISSINRNCNGFFGEKLLLQVDAAAYPGNSGGPVMDNEGEIIGILVGGLAWGGDNIGLCIPAEICERAMITYLSILEMEKLK